MLISTKGRYALRVMVDLAEHREEGFVPLKAVAQRQDISEKYLESIVKLLVQDGLLASLRGKGGGYQLTRTPEEYTIGRVLRLTESTLAPVSCLEEGTRACPRAGKCRTLSVWTGLDKVISGYLESVTVADLVGEGGEDRPAED